MKHTQICIWNIYINSKWEQFIVVHGYGLIEVRNINTGEKVSLEVFGDKSEGKCLKTLRSAA